MNLNSWVNWLKFAITIFCLILILIGFSMGRLTVDNSCTKNPLVYGIKGINSANDDNFTCSCSSDSGKIIPFSFDRDGIINTNKEIELGDILYTP